MTERREIKQRSPAVWARVKAAYLAGEPGASVARRFDVGYSNLRHRAHAEGWTRKAVMAEAEQDAAAETVRLAGRADLTTPAPAPAPGLAEIDPAEAGAAGVRQAAALIAAGRGTEALSLLKAVEELSKTLEAARQQSTGPFGDVGTDAALAYLQESTIFNAQAMLTDTGEGGSPDLGLAAYHWRARHLGPEIAAADRARFGGRYHWDADGRLLPLTELDDPHGLVRAVLDAGIVPEG
jgi:hypothetical protein